MLRKLLPIDLPTVIALEKQSQLSPWTEEIFQRCLRVGYEAYVIERDNQVIAFIIFSTVAAEGHILNLAVHPAYHRMGYASELIRFALQFATEQKVDLMLLEVRRSNLAAIHLYQKIGFVQVGKRPDYYPSHNGREDALLLAMDLTVP